MQIGVRPFLRHCASGTGTTSNRHFLLSLKPVLRSGMSVLWSAKSILRSLLLLLLLCRFAEQESSKLQRDIEMSSAFRSIEENGVGQSPTPPLA